MLFNIHILLPALFITLNGILAQETAEATSGAPDITYDSDEAFVFCSDQDCTGSCEVAITSEVPKDEGEYAAAFKSIYFHNPNALPAVLYACVDYDNCASDVTLGSNTCYNLYDNGVATDFYYYWYELDVVA